MPAISSDVCKPSEKTTLFASRDIDEFYDKVMHVLGNYFCLHFRMKTNWMIYGG